MYLKLLLGQNGGFRIVLFYPSAAAYIYSIIVIQIKLFPFPLLPVEVLQCRTKPSYSEKQLYFTQFFEARI